MRTVASQMEDAQGQTVSLRIAATSSAGETVEFGASGTVITFRGFLAAYEEGRDDDRAAPDDDEERRLPNLSEGDAVQLRELEPQGHETNPPRALHRGDARPHARGARHRPPVDVRVDPRHDPRPRLRLQAGHGARAVVPRLLGRRPARAALRRGSSTTTSRRDGGRPRPHRGRRRGSASSGSAASTSATAKRRAARARLDLGAIDAREINSLEIGDGIVLRVGRYGPYLERDGQRANVPDDLVPDELTVERAEELLAQPSGDRELGTDPETGLRDRRAHRPLRPVRHRGAAGGLEGEAAHRVALQVDVARDGDARGRAAACCSCRACSASREDGEEVVARNGRYGPYVQKEKETRSLESRGAAPRRSRSTRRSALLAQPKQRRGRGQATPPLARARRRPGRAASRSSSRRAASAPTSRTARRTRASAGATIPESLDLDGALELLAERRAKGPAKRRGTPPQGA